jgi:hypothetical protein
MIKEVDEEVTFIHAGFPVKAKITRVFKRSDKEYEKYRYVAEEKLGLHTIKHLLKEGQIIEDKVVTKFSKLTDKALMILVKKKNKQAIQEFKNRKIKK